MTAEFFDLAQRLHAAHTGTPAQRLAHTVSLRSRGALAVRARRTAQTIEVNVASEQGTDLGAGREAMVLLAAHGARLDLGRAPRMITDDSATIDILERLARQFAVDDDAAARGASAVCGWWADRADHAGTSAVIDLVSASRTRFVLGTVPGAERDAGTWRQWLELSDDTCAGLFDWAERLADGRLLPLLEEVHADDQGSFGYLCSAARRTGFDWTRPDTPMRAAMGLRSRNESADLWSAALLADPLWRRRAALTGHVTTGTIVHRQDDEGRHRVALLADRIDSRLRAGAQITGWVGDLDLMPYDRFGGEVRGTGMGEGKLMLELAGFGRGRAPDDGARVCVIPMPPQPVTLAASRRHYRELFKHGSWLSTGRTPAPVRREVPLDVLVAAAEDE